MIPGIKNTIAGLFIGAQGKRLLFGTDNVVAAGTNYATGGPLTASFNNVTGANGTKTVALPAIAAPGHMVKVYNSVAAQALLVYAPTGVSINGGSTGGSVSMTGKTMAIFIASDATNWACISS